MAMSYQMKTILGVDELWHRAESAMGGLKAGCTLSAPFLTKRGNEACAVLLVSAWRPAGDCTVIERSFPFAAVNITLEDGSLLETSSIRPERLGIFVGRRLPAPLTDYLPSSDPAQRLPALAEVRARTPRLWGLFLAGRPLTQGERAAVGRFTQARETGLVMSRHVFQEALHPEFVRWLARMG